MASILCRKGETFPNSHRHASVQEVKVCQGVIPAPRRDVSPYIRTPQPDPASGFRPTVTSILSAPSAQQKGDDWAEVNSLRVEVAANVTHKSAGARVGYFAINVPDVDGGGSVTKFYRVKVAANGRVYVDVQASDMLYPVRTPAALKLVLGRIAANPQEAKERYARELGQCYQCGRTLTDETSRRLGIGPVCRGA